MKLYNLSIPTGVRVPVVASLPHSGTYIPPNVRKQYKRDSRPILAPIDWHLEKLYDFLPELGIITIQATHSRYVVNLYRGLEEPLFGPESSSVVPYENAFKTPLYDGEVNRSDVEERIIKYYTPYHERLKKELQKTVRDYGHVYLLDLHSYFAGPVIDICLGNVNGATCSDMLIRCFETALKRHAFSVVRNEKWIGGYITRHYGNMDNVESLQIELRFPSYLDRQFFGEEEIKAWDSNKFRNAKERLLKVFSDVLDELLDLPSVS